jgi:hypothetical protein
MASSAIGHSAAFQARAEELIRRFVNTVVVVDDHAFTAKASPEAPGTLIPPDDWDEESGTGESVTKDEPSLEPEPEAAPSATNARSADVADEVAKPDEPGGAIEDDEVSLDAPRLIRLYAGQGVFCAVVEPSAEGDGWKGESLAAARRADIVILDWVLHHDQGDRAVGLIREIVDGEHGSRLRLILVYTGSPDLAAIAKRIKAGCSTPLEHEDELTLSGTHLRIVVLAKVSTVTALGKNRVRVDELPQRTFVEFAKITAGLVSNVALNGIAVLRDNTHALLARLHPDLDPPYLTHRLLLPNPGDAVDFAVDMVAQEVAALFHGYQIGDVAEEEAIHSWLEKDGKKLHPANVPKLKVDSIEKAEALLTVGVTAWAKEHIEEKDRKAFEEEAHKTGTMLFASSKERATALDREFAYRSSMIERYSKTQPPPMLTLGTTLENPEAGEFYVCIQPPCDCVRLTGERRFFFLASRETSKPNLIVQKGKALVRLQVGDGVRDLRELKFLPGPRALVEGQAEGEEFVFKDAGGVALFWRGQMKFPQAQRLANQFGSNLCRVGLDESEWLRRWARSQTVG